MFKLIRQFLGLSIFIISMTISLAFVLVIIIGVIQWYKYQENNKPREWGMSWSTKRAQELDLKPLEDLDHALSQIPFKRLQINAYWDIIEAQNNNYDFEMLLSQLQIAQSRNLKVSLQLGLHQSYGDYCHQPSWAKQINSRPQFMAELKDYLKATINQVDELVNIIQYQLEPEILKITPSQCSQLIARDELADLYQFMTDLTEKEVSLSYQPGLLAWRRQSIKADSFGIDLYTSKKILFMQVPNQYYTFHAGNFKILNSSSGIFIRKLQLQTDNQDTINPDNIDHILGYAKNTHLKIIYLYDMELIIKEDNPEVLDNLKQTIGADFS